MPHANEPERFERITEQMKAGDHADEHRHGPGGREGRGAAREAASRPRPPSLPSSLPS